MLANFNKLAELFKATFIVLILLILSGILYSVYQTLAQSTTHAIKPNNAYTKAQYSYYVDDNSTLATDDLTDFLPLFKASKVNEIPFTLSKKSYWIKVEIKSYADNTEQLVLHADNTMLSNLDIYQLKDDQISSHLFSLKDNTHLINSITRPLTSYEKAFPHITFELKSFEQKEFLIRLNTVGPPNVLFILYKNANFDKRTLLTETIFGAFIGIFLLMSVYNLVIYFAVKDKVYLVYIGYLLNAFLVLASINGFGYLIFPQVLQELINNYIILLDALLVVFLLLFALYFLRYDKANNKGYKTGMAFVGVMLIFSAISLFLDEIVQTKIFFSLQPFFYIFSLYLVFTRLKNDFTWAKFYFFSWVPLLIGATVQPLMLLNYINYSFIARHAFLIGVLIEVAFMAFALAERMRRYEQDRHHDIGYHRSTKLPRKLILEDTISTLISKGTDKFSVVVIKPEQMERIALYVDDATNVSLFRNLNKKLASLLNYNDAIVELTNLKEKLCFLENSVLALIIDHKKNHQPIQVVINSIQQIVSENYKINTLQLPLSAVVGVANYPEHGDTGHLLINRAQLALRNAESSHQKWSYFTSEISDKTHYLLMLAADMKAALANNHFEIYHQPQIDLKTLRVCGSECLVRWNHPTEGNIPPNIFIPVAEDMGLINQITLWVINKALSQHREIVENGFTNHMVSINISGKDIASDNFYLHVEELIKLSDVAPEKIILELTESAAITNSKEALTVLNKLSDLGITISIDDFGTGYSSMAYITELPFQELKVDRQFVENVCDSIKRRTICETTVKMAKGLKLEVVAEGINSELDERTLRTFGCDIGQGYYYAKPMPLAEYLNWLEEQVNGHTPQPPTGEFIPADRAPKTKVKAK